MTRDEIVIGMGWPALVNHVPNYADDLICRIESIIRSAKAAEREECAKVCDDYEDWCDTWGQDDKHIAAVSAASELAQAIRARGEK
jgi:hypothetical protein